MPFYLTDGTRRRVNPKVLPRRIERARAGVPIRIGSIVAEPVAVSHDTPEPVAWIVEVRGTRVGVITDLGRVTPAVERAFVGLDIAVLEFNHDLQMLRDGPYPLELKRRIEAPWGHLSNDQAAELLAKAGSRLSHVVLAHLSEDNNTPARARAAADRALHAAGRRNVEVGVGSPYAPVLVSTARVTPAATVAPRPQVRADRRPPRARAVPVEQGSLFGPSSG